MADLKPYHYPVQYEQLLGETTEHELNILHSDDLYRHLRFQRPGTSIWHWDLITWPGSLAICGDVGQGYIFTRERDMLTFFDYGQPDGHINAGYWAEKLNRGSRSVRAFSDEKFRAWLDGRQMGPNTIFDERDDMTENLDWSVGSMDTAVSLLHDADIAWDADDPETWQDYEYHFILALHAILWGAKKYHAEVA